MTRDNKVPPALDCIDHLECILPEGGDREKKVNAILKVVYTLGHEPIYVIGSPSLELGNPMQGIVLAVGYTEGIQVVCAYDNRHENIMLSSFYPVGKPMESVAPRTGLCNFVESENDLEAYGGLQADPLNFSVANYPSLKSREEYKNMLPFSVDIIGFCYHCIKVNETLQKDERTVDISMSKCHGKLPQDKTITLDLTYEKLFIQSSDTYPDEFSFASLVFDLDELTVFGLPMYRMKIMTKQARSLGEDEEFITVYAKKMMFPNGLKVGDFVKGTGWLQGVFR